MTKHRIAVLFVPLITSIVAAAPLGTAITYQGQLKSEGVPIIGSADLRFTLWDAATGGNFDPDILTTTDVPVVNGFFSVELDFGSGAFEGSKKWLEIEVRYPAARGGAFTRLAPRQPITAAPYALYALNSPGGGGGGTLDAAYDFGGPGIGRTINADSGPVNIAGSNGLTVTGPVGVGTIDPQFELDVFDADTSSGVPSATYDTRLGVRHDLTTLGLGTSSRWFYMKAGADATLTRNDGADLHFEIEVDRSASPVSQMTLTEGGNLGIGTISPKGRLHVNGDYYGRGHLWLHAFEGDGQSGTAYIQARDTSATSHIDLQFRTKSGATYRDSMRLESNGDVIIPGKLVPGSIDIGYEIVSAESLDDLSLTVECPQGKRTLGGGCFCNAVNTVVASRPASSGTAWFCSCLDSGYIHVDAICANVN